MTQAPADHSPNGAVVAESPEIEQLGSAWLQSALSGGLPTPGRLRWQPLRVGIANLWEYDDAEFWFADGRLVLRGGNGAGKTKVLELTTLLLLRGEIAPSVLDPFGSQHRTMRFNLLPTGDGDDPRAPADAGLGYAWVEFGRRTEAGSMEFFTCGLGASARAGTGSTQVTTWRFVTRSRLGRDFRLISEGRALARKDLEKIDGIELPVNAAAYRSRLASELFGITAESYDNLTELLKQLRKPKLGERLNPASLAATLRDALPPLAAHEVDQLADGWEHLEQLRTAVQRTEDAARAIAQFVRTGWRPWARVVMRRRADEMTSATTGLDNTTAAKKDAEQKLEQARVTLGDAEAQLRERDRERTDSDTALRELLESDAYRDAVTANQRVEGMRRDLTNLRDRRRAVGDRVERDRTAESTAAQLVTTERSKCERAGEAVREAAGVLTRSADQAGLAEPVAQYLPNDDVDAITAAHAARTEKFQHLRRLDRAQSDADARVQRSAHAVEIAENALVKAQSEENEAQEAVQRNADNLTEQIRVWNGVAEVAVATDEVAGHWYDLVAEMTVVDDTGMREPQESVVDAMRGHIAGIRNIWTERLSALRLERAPVETRRTEVVRDLARTRAMTEAAPPAPATWRRRDRPEPSEQAGAPLWRLVDPVPGLDAGKVAVLEAALAASGLLDAWVSPHGTIDFDTADVMAGTGGGAGVPRGATLLTVLEPAAAGGVEPAVIERVLSAFGWSEGSVADAEPDGDRFAADGSWRLGGVAGRAEPAGPAAYLGAAAREAEKARRIAVLETELQELLARLSELDEQIGAASGALEQLRAEQDALPARGERELADSVVRWGDRQRARIAREGEHRTAETTHADDRARYDEARAKFAEYAATQRFPMTGLDAQGEALTNFRNHLNSYSTALVTQDLQQNAVDAAVTRHTEAAERLRDAEQELDGVSTAYRQVQVRLETAEQALRSDHRQQLDRKATLDNRVRELGKEVNSLTIRVSDAKVAQATATEVLQSHEERRAEAEQRRDTAMTALWEAVDSGLLQAVDLESPERQNVQNARELATAIRRQADVQAGDADVERAWRSCSQKMEALRQNLLPQQDARVLDDEGTLPRVEIHTGAPHGYQLPPAATDTLAERVREQRAGYDAEQQRVLATLLGSTFIEHLKDRLDYTTRTFTNINTHLAAHPTRQGHAVKVDWEADPADPDAESVVGALSRGYDQLSPDRQQMVRDFLTRKIDQARAEADAEGASDWKQQLTQALDYRRWLKISLQYRPGATSRWSRFDAAKHGAKSGGEKVVLLSQPLFAAAVVAYDAAAPHAPRCVWLDEAMTGVDAQVKASFMGLTVDFELDIMLTAHDEWCTYDTVPAVAVYDLARERHLPGVDVLPYLWCGGTWTEVDVDRLGAAQAREPMPAAGLFGLGDDGS
ncbi:TIGR02680 family protein [Nocardia macrotermitis]|uniref:TIGR02680 family protein n=1 Tax=Nocardia macrotermitis TaxID=2585198 RepID=A0A7K0D310_9NOCA|nr:TIGR02680 family protein [Nocardia macrotermitis]MQY20109.1 hypothetical protein [Nocardia macrotermitis]